MLRCSEFARWVLKVHMWWREGNSRRWFSIALTCVLASWLSFAHAQAIDTPAQFAYLIDLSSNTVLLEKAADVPTAPASMSKMMTVLMVLERLKSGALKPDDTFPVSEKAWKKGGSKMFVKVDTRVRVDDLLRGIIVQSGNDACIVVAEGLAGSEEAFAEQMTAKARELGLINSHFVNATGWPDDGHLMSAKDLATLAHILIANYPQAYVMFSEKSFAYNGITQNNRNPVLSDEIGADGLKTGHTERSGYGLTASAKRGDRRLVLVLNGLESTSQRAQEAERLLEWGFRSFEGITLFKAQDKVEEAPVWLGERASVPLVIAERLAITLPQQAKRQLQVSIRYDAPIPSPVQKGQVVGKLTVTAPGMEPVERPLIAGADVSPLGPVGRVLALTQHWLARVLP
jgi:serine-type D-Ala-D-Ala carboxypeptidase (penicillin-binding protein 5/6)